MIVNGDDLMDKLGFVDDALSEHGLRTLWLDIHLVDGTYAISSLCYVVAPHCPGKNIQNDMPLI